MPVERCNRCAGEARLTSHIAPFGREPGYRIFYCESCDHFTRVTWRGSFRQQQQQQQQSQPPQAEDE
jgi:late competence protein required for DNA uptake (superfamily II DNA/RNA helicase)